MQEGGFMGIMNVKANYAKLIDLVLFTVATLAAAVLVMGICRPDCSTT